MVHTWISLNNNQINKKCLNYKIINIFKNSESFFGGDYTLDIFVGVKQDYKTIEDIINNTIIKSNNWIQNIDIEYNCLCMCNRFL